MTRNARTVLADCRIALSMLEEEADPQKWRVLWAAAVALVRAVGHVLDKVDSTDNDAKTVSGDFFKKWKRDPDHIIFREFIERERNNLLKEYHSDIHPLEKVQVLLQLPIVPLAGGEARTLAHVMELDENLFRPLLEGPWEGIDGREVLGEAIDWWEGQLDAIDDAVRRKKSSNADKPK